MAHTDARAVSPYDRGLAAGTDRLRNRSFFLSFSLPFLSLSLSRSSISLRPCSGHVQPSQLTLLTLRLSANRITRPPPHLHTRPLAPLHALQPNRLRDPVLLMRTKRPRRLRLQMQRISLRCTSAVTTPPQPQRNRRALPWSPPTGTSGPRSASPYCSRSDSGSAIHSRLPVSRRRAS